MEKIWKTGELADQTGITIRTLRHYHQIGLLIPSMTSKAGHRLYTEKDIAKLHQILSLKQMGLSLEEIKNFIDSPSYNPNELIKSQIEVLKEQIEQKQVLLQKLQDLYTIMESNKSLDTSELFSIMVILQKDELNYWSKEQLTKLKLLGSRYSKQQQADLRMQWDEFISSLRKHTEKNIPLTEASVKKLVDFWSTLISHMTDNDSNLIDACERFHFENSNNPLSFGLTPEMYKYLQKAVEEYGSSY